jgi:hypothetical protein
MKNQIIISLFLLATFYITPVFAQEKTDLVAEIIEFKIIKIPDGKKEVFLAAFLRPLLSRKGSVEFDTENQKFNFTDSQNRLKLIKKFTEVLDNSGFRINDFLAKSVKDKKNISESVRTFYLYPVLECDVGEGARLAKISLQENLLVKTLAEIKVNGERYSVLDSGGGINLTGTKRRVVLAKKFVALFDKPILTEVEDF